MIVQVQVQLYCNCTVQLLPYTVAGLTGSISYEALSPGDVGAMGKYST
jgi:hypothetical protein